MSTFITGFEKQAALWSKTKPVIENNKRSILAGGMIAGTISALASNVVNTLLGSKKNTPVNIIVVDPKNKLTEKQAGFAGKAAKGLFLGGLGVGLGAGAGYVAGREVTKHVKKKMGIQDEPQQVVVQQPEKIAFVRGFEKKSDEAVTKDGRKVVSVIGVINDDKILLGKRRDNGRWTNPGGHLNEGEDPKEGAIRELKEETGLTPKTIKHLKSENVTTHTGKKYVIHAFQATIDDPKTTMQQDPDKEVERWQWISIRDGISEEVLNNLHSPKNVLLKALGLMDYEENSEKKAEVPLATLLSLTDDLAKVYGIAQREKQKQHTGPGKPRKLSS